MTENPFSVLIVEDSEDWRNLYSAILEAQGLQFVAVASLTEAQAQLQTRKYTHVLTDGLEGEWSGVVKEANNAGIRNIYVISGRSGIKLDVSNSGASYVNKRDIGLGVVNVKDLIK